MFCPICKILVSKFPPVLFLLRLYTNIDDKTHNTIEKKNVGEKCYSWVKYSPYLQLVQRKYTDIAHLSHLV